VFAGNGADGSMWVPIVEKIWAKYNMNYEGIAGGLTGETRRFLTGSPTNSYMTADYAST